MYLDGQLEFSSAQAINGVTTTATASTNLIDLKAANLQIGKGTPLVIRVYYTVTAAGAGATVVVTLEQDTLAAFGSATTIGTIGTFAALAAAGTGFDYLIPISAVSEQFIRLMYTVAGGTLTVDTGLPDAHMVLDVAGDYQHADGRTITTGAL